MRARATSMSDLITPSMCRTPAWPPAATAQTQARPMRTARAPESDHLDHVEPGADPAVDQHLEPDRPPHRPRRAGPAPSTGTESSWRPPWLETMTPSTPTSAARRASSGSSTPLTTSRPSQFSRTQAMSSQVTLGSNWESTHSRKAAGVPAPGTAFSRFPKVSGRPPMPTSRIHRGCRAMSSPRSALAQAGRLARRRRCERRDGERRHGQIDGQDEHRRADGAGPGHQLLARSHGRASRRAGTTAGARPRPRPPRCCRPRASIR